MMDPDKPVRIDEHSRNIWSPEKTTPQDFVNSFIGALNARQEHIFYKNYPQNEQVGLVDAQILSKIINQYVLLRYPDVSFNEVEREDIGEIVQEANRLLPMEFNDWVDGCLMPFGNKRSRGKKYFANIVSGCMVDGSHEPFSDEDKALALRSWLIEVDRFVEDHIGEFDKQMRIFNQQTPLLVAQSFLD